MGAEPGQLGCDVIALMSSPSSSGVFSAESRSVAFPAAGSERVQRVLGSDDPHRRLCPDGELNGSGLDLDQNRVPVTELSNVLFPPPSPWLCTGSAPVWSGSVTTCCCAHQQSAEPLGCRRRSPKRRTGTSCQPSSASTGGRTNWPGSTGTTLVLLMVLVDSTVKPVRRTWLQLPRSWFW